MPSWKVTSAHTGGAIRRASGSGGWHVPPDLHENKLVLPHDRVHRLSSMWGPSITRRWLFLKHSISSTSFHIYKHIRSLTRWALVLSRVSRLRTLPPWEGSSSVATYPTTPDGLWATGLKKDLAALCTQLGSRVFKSRSCVTEAPVRHACR
jgi:hypothetical protein